MLTDFFSWLVADSTIVQLIYGFMIFVGGIMVVISLLMFLFGFDDLDADTDFDDGGNDKLGLFSFHGISILLVVTGLAGKMFYSVTGPALSMILGLIIGFLVNALISFILLKIKTFLSESGNIDLKDLIGSIGEVYIPINSEPGGLVLISKRGSKRSYKAKIKETEELISTGTSIKVIDEIGGFLIVQKIIK